MTAPSTNPPPEAPSARQGTTPGRRSLIGRAFAALLRALHHTSGIVVLAAFALLVALTVWGLPRPVIDAGLRRLRREGLCVEVGRVRLDLLYGVALEQVRFFDEVERPVPMIEADRVILSFSVRDWLSRRAGFRGLRIRGAVLRINAAGDLRRRESPWNLVMDHVNVVLRVEPGGLRLAQLESLALGMQVKGQGLITTAAATGTVVSLRDVSRALSATLNNLPSWLPRFAEEVNAVTFASPPEVSVDFTFYPTNRWGSLGRVAARGGATLARGVAFDTWDLGASLSNGVLALDRLSAECDGKRCDISGSMKLGDRMTEVRVFSSIAPSNWLSLAPAAVATQLADAGFDLSGDASFELWGGPAPLSNVIEKASGWISMQRATLRGIWVEKGFFAVRREGPLLSGTKIEAVIGKGKDQGPVKGTAWFRLDTKEYGVDCDTAASPYALDPVWNRNQSNVVHTFGFSTPPRGQLKMTGVADNPKLFRLDGHVWGTNVTRYGVPVDYVESDVSVTTGVLRLESLVVVRKEGRAEGRAAINFDFHAVDADAVSTIDAHALARMIDPKVEKTLRQYRFEGRTRVVGKGHVDYQDPRGTDFEAFVEGERMGLKWALADRGSFHLRAVGTDLTFSRVEGEIYGGRFSGEASFHSVHRPACPYEISGSLQGVRFRDLVTAMREVEKPEPYEGLLSGRATFSGLLNNGPSVIGEGQVQIKKGQLFQIPLFGGLSQYLSRIYPGLGFATQTDFAGSFTIRDSACHSVDAELLGAVLSVRGEGRYGFDESVDFNVQVMLLRQGTVASVLRLVTFPVTKLLEFHLGGSLEKPRWRPINLPKEMFLIFD